ncbi:peptidase C14, caspase domain-containing protein [Amanita rubescens]|nr:peptidase C14, caspase domain-containing protein [Amanita rubescens]
MPRRKSLLIGINYFNSSTELAGCINDVENVRQYLINDKGFPHDPSSMVVLTDDRPEPHYQPTGQNMLSAFHWLVSNNNPGDSLFLHYSGHGGQVQDPDGDRESGLDDTICPVDFEKHGQITSDTLHRVLVSPLAPGVRLTVIFDCCHSGTAIELPFVYRSNEDGQIGLVDNIKKGVKLAVAARALIQGGFSMQKVDEVKQLISSANSFFKGLSHHKQPEGLGEETFVEDWRSEGKDVWMFSGRRDDQTSADTSIANEPTGAMSWAFINTMREFPGQSYVEILRRTRVLLSQEYDQIPQLSVGAEFDLNQPVAF